MNRETSEILSAKQFENKLALLKSKRNNTLTVQVDRGEYPVNVELFIQSRLRGYYNAYVFVYLLNERCDYKSKILDQIYSTENKSMLSHFEKKSFLRNYHEALQNLKRTYLLVIDKAERMSIGLEYFLQQLQTYGCFKVIYIYDSFQL